MKDHNLVLKSDIEDYFIDYNRIKDSIKNLSNVNSKLEFRTFFIKNDLTRLIYKIKDQIISKSKYSINEIINSEIDLIKNIRKSLEYYENKTNIKLENLLDYSFWVDQKISTNLEYNLKETPLIEKRKKDLEIKQAAMASNNPLESFNNNVDYKKSLREYNKDLHKLELINDSIADLLMQRSYLDFQEIVLNNTMNTSQRLIERTKRIESQTIIIKGIYELVLKQSDLYEKLSLALKSQKENILSLNNIIVTGQKNILQISNNFELNQNNNNFSDISSLTNLNLAKEYLNMSNYDRFKEKENKITENINN